MDKNWPKMWNFKINGELPKLAKNDQNDQNWQKFEIKEDRLLSDQNQLKMTKLDWKWPELIEND